MTSESIGKRPRSYRKRRRAELEAQTRERIAAATAKLHQTVGPAQTTVSGIAREAGVQRATVYRHFPDEESLFEACTAHYYADNPLPNPAQWIAIADPDLRLHRALTEVYAWYGRSEAMIERTSRDRPLVPAMAAAAGRFLDYFETVRETLMRGRRERGRRRSRARAAIGHALAFPTWRSLVREQGLAEEDAVELMMDLVRPVD